MPTLRAKILVLSDAAAGGRREDRSGPAVREVLEKRGWLVQALEVLPDDLRVKKIKYSAFIAGSSDIDAQLKSRGIDSVLIAGTATNVCCESSARDAMMLDYRVIMLSDANAASTDEEHAATLNSFMLFFGDVMTADEAIGKLATAPVRKTA